MGNEKKYCVYRHVSPKGKMYVGITSKHPFARWSIYNGSGYNNQPYFHNAINTPEKWQSFKHEVFLQDGWIPIVERLPKSVTNIYTKEEAVQLEQYFISKYNLKDRRYGYNGTDGGDGVHGYKMSEEEKEKKRKAWTGPNNPRFGHKYSDEEKQHLRKMNSRWSPNEEQRAKISASLTGHIVSEETKQKLRAALIGRTHTEETRKKLSESHKGERHFWYGKHLPESTKLKISESHEKIGVYQVDRNSKKIIGYFKSISDAERAVNSRHIVTACKGTRFCTQGYIWIYEADLCGLSDAEKAEVINSRCTPPKIVREGTSVIQLDLTGQVIKIYPTIREAARETNTQRHSLKLALIGEQRTAGSSIWCYYQLWSDMDNVEKTKYIKDRTNIQTCRRGRSIVNLTTGKEYSSIKEASLDTGVDQSSISACCYGKRKTAGGSKWDFLS